LPPRPPSPPDAPLSPGFRRARRLHRGRNRLRRVPRGPPVPEDPPAGVIAGVESRDQHLARVVPFTHDVPPRKPPSPPAFEDLPGLHEELHVPGARRSATRTPCSSRTRSEDLSASGPPSRSLGRFGRTGFTHLMYDSRFVFGELSQFLRRRWRGSGVSRRRDSPSCTRRGSCGCTGSGGREAIRPLPEAGPPRSADNPPNRGSGSGVPFSSLRTTRRIPRTRGKRARGRATLGEDVAVLPQLEEVRLLERPIALPGLVIDDPQLPAGPGV